ncbi:MAG: ABC transporter permease [Bacteroidota bacterium]
MLKDVLNTSIRSLLKNKAYSVISIFCLLLGLAACFNIWLFVDDELKYDKFHQDHENIYRITAEIVSAGIVYDEARCQFPLAEKLKATYPGVKKTIRLYQPRVPLIVYEDHKFLENRFLFADSSFFELFGFELIRGEANRVLKHPNSVVITESMAKKYFGSEDPIGKFIKYNNEQPLEVTGLVRDFHNSHIAFDFLAPLSLQLSLWQQTRGISGPENKWFWTGVWTYVQFEEGSQKALVEDQLPAFVKDNFPEAWKDNSTLKLQRIDNIHLTSDLIREIQANGSLSNIRIFSILAIILLFIAGFNFVNLMNAQSAARAEKVSIKKVLGASNVNIIAQVLFETFTICLVAGALAIVVTYFTVPLLNLLVGKSIDLGSYLTPEYIGLFLLIILLLALLAGIYPAIHLSKFGVYSLRKSAKASRRKIGIKELLVGAQFMYSAGLIVSVITIHQQQKFLANKDLGFDKENVLLIKAQQEQDENFEAFKNELLRIPDVLSVSGVYDAPGESVNSIRFVPEGGTRSDPVLLPISSVGYDFLETLNIDLIDGRFFSKDFPTDYDEAFILNESAVKELGWQADPVGKKLEMFGAGSDEIGMRGKIIGVMKDYNHESLHSSIKPTVFILAGGNRYYLLKFSTNDYAGLLDKVNAVWTSFGELWPIEYQLLDQRMELLYQKEEKLAVLMDIALGLALLIGCIGIFGLSSYIIKGRVKEVSIRRVLGGRTDSMVFLLSKKFIMLVIISNIIAWPITYITMNNWLSNFEFSVEIDWLLFLLAGAITLFLTFAITSFHSIRIARLNPVETLKND